MKGILRATAAALLLLGSMTTVGCGEGREFAEVEGRVTLDGNPLADVEIVFMPDSLKGNKGNCASAYTDSEGRYTLHAPRDNRDGTVLGSHRVVVIDLTSIVPPGGGGAPPTAEQAKEPVNRGRAKQRRFPPKYSDTADTPFKDVDVKSGKQTLDFDLKSKS